MKDHLLKELQADINGDVEKTMNILFTKDEAAVLLDILNVYFNSVHDEIENTDDGTNAYRLLAQRMEESLNLIREFDAMIQGSGAK